MMNTVTDAPAVLKSADHIPVKIRDFAGQIAARFHPDKIILFGSHARGDARPDSDVDLLVVVPHTGRPAQKAAEIICGVNHPFPVDLLVRSPQRLRERLSLGDFFFQEIINTGIVLYDADRP